MKRVGGGIAVIMGTLMLVTPPAAAATGSAWVTPKAAEPLESAGEVVLTVSHSRAGRVAYQTIDGACQVDYSAGGSPPDAVCSGEKARAPGDYTATSGELVFTEGGSKTITIPIVDNDLGERDEMFTLAVWEEVHADGWISPATRQPPNRGDSAIVLIVDDEGGNTGGDESTGSAEGAPAPNSASKAGVNVDPATPETTTRPSRNLQVALPAGELRPGPGLALTSERPRGRALERGGGGGSVWWLASWIGSGGVGIGALAFVRRRRRWSSTQA